MKTLITKYLNETISEDEKLRLIEWLQTSKNQKTFKEFVKIHSRLNRQYVPTDDEKAYRALMSRVSETKKTKSGRKIIPFWLKYAAVIVGVAILGYSVFMDSPQPKGVSATPQITLELEDGSILVIDEVSNKTIVDADGNKVSQQKNNTLVYEPHTVGESLTYNTLSVPHGKTFKLLLSDSSKVVLNAGSTLKYPVKFLADEARTVFLNGEGYFEISEDPEHPFTVQTQDMDVSVLGTHFNVNSYDENPTPFAVLVSGKVRVQNKLMPEEQKILQPNEIAYFKEDRLNVSQVNVRKYVAWIQGQLVFINDSFDVIIKKLERKYDVRIVNNYAALEEINITATFTDESIEQVLKTFQTYKDFNWTLKDGVITIDNPNN